MVKAEAKEAKEVVNASLARVQKLTDRLRAGKRPQVLPDWVTEGNGQPPLPIYRDDAVAEATPADAEAAVDV